MKTRKIYIDGHINWEEPKIDDFIVAIGKTKSNSVYHIASVRGVPHKKTSWKVRYYLEVVTSDLCTALQRDPEQKLIPMAWYKRKKKGS